MPRLDRLSKIRRSETLETLYTGHGDCVSHVTQVVNENLADGYITRNAAQTTRTDVAQSDIGK